VQARDGEIGCVADVVRRGRWRRAPVQ
jgi:hypothetical protein